MIGKVFLELLKVKERNNFKDCHPHPHNKERRGGREDRRERGGGVWWVVVAVGDRRGVRGTRGRGNGGMGGRRGSLLLIDSSVERWDPLHRRSLLVSSPLRSSLCHLCTLFSRGGRVSGEVRGAMSDEWWLCLLRINLLSSKFTPHSLSPPLAREQSAACLIRTLSSPAPDIAHHTLMTH